MLRRALSEFTVESPNDLGVIIEHVLELLSLKMDKSLCPHHIWEITARKLSKVLLL